MAKTPTPTAATPPTLDLRTARQLEKLRRMPSRDHAAAQHGRNAFLTEAQSLRLKEPSIRLSWYDWLGRLVRPRPGLLLRALIVIVAISGTVVATSSLATATQYSLPNQWLYPLKQWMENGQLAFARTPQDRSDLALTFAFRRIKEIELLNEQGLAVPESVLARMHHEIAFALEAASHMDDAAMQQALQDTDGQLLLQEEVLRQANPPVSLDTLDLIERQRLWVELGLLEPQGFREQIRTLGTSPLAGPNMP